jgi:hypothetical protein
MSGVGKKKEAPGRGVLFGLPLHLQVNIMSRIPIIELRRLHKGKVSPHFFSCHQENPWENRAEVSRGGPGRGQVGEPGHGRLQAGVQGAIHIHGRGRVAGGQGLFCARLLLEGRTTFFIPARGGHRVEFRGCRPRYLDRGGSEVPAQHHP